ncbi:protein involved in spore germination [Arthrobacter sp. Hiyo4]|nr:protein involved in spore germination [Arthrobacter sp. Hiyo4]
MLEKLLPFWRGKIFVLILLGFVATSWIITITLSAADATVHMLENPYLPPFLDGQAVPITVVLLLILGGVFLLGFSEAVAVAIPLVAVFLVFNAVIIGAGMYDAVTQPVPWLTGRRRSPPPGPASAISPDPPSLPSRCWSWACQVSRPASA